MAVMLRENRSLTCLHLYGNDITDEGVQSFMDVLLWGNSVIWTLNLGGNFGGEQQPNSKMHQVHRLTRINRFTDFRVRLMVTVILVHANSNKKGNTSDRAVGDKVQGDSLWRTLHKATNMDSENSGLFRKFIDLGLRRFYNDVDDVSRKISGR